MRDDKKGHKGHHKAKGKTNKPSENQILRAQKLKAMVAGSQKILPKKPGPIAFSSPAVAQNPNTNSLGEAGITPKDNINLNNWPIMVGRCDQMIHIPVTYINNEDDFRVRRDGFVTISAHRTNLFDAKDAQKLVQSTEHSLMRGEPCHINGARGCIRVSKDKNRRLHNIDICVGSMVNAENLIYVYKMFQLCRKGDSLIPITAEMLKKLKELCKNKKLKGKRNPELERDCNGKIKNPPKKKEEKVNDPNRLPSAFKGQASHVDPDDKIGEEKYTPVEARLNDKKSTLEARRLLPRVFGNKHEFNRRSYKVFGAVAEPSGKPPVLKVPGDLNIDKH